MEKALIELVKALLFLALGIFAIAFAFVIYLFYYLYAWDLKVGTPLFLITLLNLFVMLISLLSYAFGYSKGNAKHILYFIVASYSVCLIIFLIVQFFK